MDSYIQKIRDELNEIFTETNGWGGPIDFFTNENGTLTAEFFDLSSVEAAKDPVETKTYKLVEVTNDSL